MSVPVFRPTGPGPTGECPPASAPDLPDLSPPAAARALGIGRDELALAVQLGHLRATAISLGFPVAVPAAEIERQQTTGHLPVLLRERVRLLGTRAAAALLDITTDRLTRLARLGLLTPTRFYPNRYRAIVWLYLADDLKDFQQHRPALLTGRLPQPLLRRLADGEDLRARSWRYRRLELHLNITRDPWQRAAAVAAQLDPDTLAAAVPDPSERCLLQRLQPDFPAARSGPPAAQDLAQRLLTADTMEETEALRLRLLVEIEDARSAGRPDAAATAAPGPYAGNITAASSSDASPPRAPSAVTTGVPGTVSDTRPPAVVAAPPEPPAAAPGHRAGVRPARAATGPETATGGPCVPRRRLLIDRLRRRAPGSRS
jgi:hypothetical protein